MSSFEDIKLPAGRGSRHSNRQCRILLVLSDDKIVAKFRNCLGLMGERDAILSYSKSLLLDAAANTSASQNSKGLFHFLLDNPHTFLHNDLSYTQRRILCTTHYAT